MDTASGGHGDMLQTMFGGALADLDDPDEVANFKSGLASLAGQKIFVRPRKGDEAPTCSSP